MACARGMLMTKNSTAQGDLGARIPPGPSRRLSKVAGPFTFHGHRLASLYREDKKPLIPFIFPKIRKKPRSISGGAFAYLEKDEGQGVRP